MINKARMRRPIDTKKNPITHPARKATRNPAVIDVIHSYAVLVLEYVAIFIPTYPDNTLVKHPTKKEMKV